MQNNEEHIRDIINTLYKSSGINTTFKGNVTPELAIVVGDLIVDIKRCSSAFYWVPEPNAGKATVMWLVKNMTKSTLKKLKKKESIACSKARVWQYRTRIELASMGEI